MNDKVKVYLQEQGFNIVNNEEDFLKMYPSAKRGEYRPQPNIPPSSYPCMIREESIIDNPNGADEAIISIIY